MFSINTDRWSSPRPETLNLSAESPSSTRRATLCSSSRSRRSLILRLVTYLPSLPAKGESLTWKVMLTVGSSTSRGGNASTWLGSQMVSEIFKRSIPEIQTIRSEEHTSELQSRPHLVCRLLLDPATPEIYTLSLHDALPISLFDITTGDVLAFFTCKR